MTTYLLISPDDTIDADAVVVAEFQKAIYHEGSTVVTLRSPVVAPWDDPNDPLVGWIYDWGKVMGLPVNLKAWALYGRSPIYGPMLVASDHRRPLDPEFIAMLGRPIEGWVPAEAFANMTRILSVASDATVDP